MKDGAQIGMAVGLGYLLGRTRKMRLALMLVGVGVTGKLGKGPAGLVKQGVGALGSSPEVKTLTDTLRGRLVEVGKTAAISAVSSQVDTLTDKIEERTGSLSSPPVPGRAEETKAEETKAEESKAEETKEDAGEEEREERASERRPRRPAARRPAARRPRRTESADEPTDNNDEHADDEHRDERPRRSARPPGQRPPVRRTRRREQ